MLEDDLFNTYQSTVLPNWEKNGQPISFRTDDGLTIRGMSFIQPDRKSAIVISSGRTESFIKYKELIYDLWIEGFSVFIIDHRGQGFSDRILPDENKRQMGYVKNFKDYVTDLKQLYSEFVQPTEHQHNLLLAHSMGGCIASLYLETYTRDFDAAVLSSPMDELALGFFPHLAGAIVDFDDLIGRDADYAPGKSGYDENEVFSDKCLTHSQVRWTLTRREYAQNPDTKLGGPSVLWVKRALEAAINARQDASKVEIPTLLLQAGDDTIVKPSGQLEFHDRLDQAHPGLSQLERIDGARHEMFVESDSYRRHALGLTIDFFKKHTSVP
jgi:lysophospholipase